MSLKVILRGNERAIIGGAVVRNAAARPIALLVENAVPVLRERQILSAAAANSPAARLYFTAQLMYVEPNRQEELRPLFVTLVEELVHAAPSTRSYVKPMSLAVAQGDYYHALKLGWKLMDYERTLLANVESSSVSL